jgi:hypothetical protein
MILILKYLSPLCKYTGNSSELEQAISKYGRGNKTSGELKQDIKRFKRIFDTGEKDEFSKHYTDVYLNNPDPLNDNDQYKFLGSKEDIIQFTDNVIFFKNKMISDGKRV